MMVGCIPVIIADEIEFPYENTVDWCAPSLQPPHAVDTLGGW